MGLSEKQAVMAAGCAGGIGLSGGACGALGVAIWTLTLNNRQDQKLKHAFKNPLFKSRIHTRRSGTWDYYPNFFQETRSENLTVTSPVLLFRVKAL